MRRHIAFAACLAVAAGAGLALAQDVPPSTAKVRMIKFQIKDGGIPVSLTGHKGDPKKGREVAVGRTLGNCLACHEITALKDEPYHGNVGPSLDGVADRLSEAQIRLRVVDPTKLNADTMMPPFYRVDGLNKVMHKFQGVPILTADQVEDVVAFLETLK